MAWINPCGAQGLVDGAVPGDGLLSAGNVNARPVEVRAVPGSDGDVIGLELRSSKRDQGSCLQLRIRSASLSRAGPSSGSVHSTFSYTPAAIENLPHPLNVIQQRWVAEIGQA